MAGAMPTREQMIADLQNKQPSREQMIADLQGAQQSKTPAADTPAPGMIESAYNTYAAARNKAVSFLAESKNPFFQGADYLLNGPGADQLGGLARSGVAAVSGLATKGENPVTAEDMTAVGQGHGPGLAEYAGRMGVPEGPSVDTSAAQDIPVIGKYLPGKVNVRNATGFIADALTNPLTYLGAGQLGKEALQDVGAQAATLVAKPVTKAASGIFLVPEKEITAFANNADKIMEMAEKSKIRGKVNTARAADQLKEGFNAAIKQTRSEMNEQIGTVLDESNATVSSKSILQALNEHVERLDPKVDTDLAHIAEIKQIMSTVTGAADEAGEIPVKTANRLKQTLQEEAEATYNQDPGAKMAAPAARAAQAAAAVTRGLVDKAVPAVAPANRQLQLIHNKLAEMNKSLLKRGKSAKSLLDVGSGTSEVAQANLSNLEDLGQATGKDMVGDAENLAAMRTFGKPKLTGGVGSQIPILNHIPGLSTALGAVTSPAVLKQGINAAKGASKLANALSAPAGKALGQSIIHGNQGVSEVRGNKP